MTMQKKRDRVITGWRQVTQPKAGVWLPRPLAVARAKPAAERQSDERWEAEGGHLGALPKKESA